jgi:hypothetical protein
MDQAELELSSKGMGATSSSAIRSFFRGALRSWPVVSLLWAVLLLGIYDSSCTKSIAEKPVEPVLSVALLGTGGVEYCPERFGPGVLVRYENLNILVDMGAGARQQLYKLGVNGARDLDYIIFTHHHMDHNAEFPMILGQSLLGGRLQQIIGPPGTAKLVDFDLDFYRGDRLYRGSREY